MYRIKDLPPSEKPRERLIEKGPGALSNAELLAIILRVGNRSQNVLEFSRGLLKDFGLKRLFNSGFEELSSVNGLAKAKACQLIACGELARRVLNGQPQQQHEIANPIDAVRECEDIRHRENEHLIALYLNSRHRLIKKSLISMGNLDSSIVDPREVYKLALRCNAYGVILVHNHPSGDPEPSNDDIQITQHIKEAGNILNVCLIDHIIMGSNRFTSLSERGLL